ncbi:MAG: homoserine kinase [Cytophagaceae bacterium]|nr:homoserine kinase [Cytophagaceae bacterium]MDW8455841.1 homoserine kinase [Cytophagaceae bacterium]
MEKSIRVFAPATVANVTCGFDILGFAVSAPGDEVVVTLKKSPGITISEITGDGGRLSKDPSQNTVSVPILRYLEKIKSKQGFDIKLHKKMPLGSGLGSSSASSVAGVFAANILLGEPLKRIELLPFAMEGERVACGSAHADNVAPALLGGFVLVRSYRPLDVVKIPTPASLYATIIHPHIEVRTKDARSILRNDLSLHDAIVQWGNVAGLVCGLLMSDYGLIGRSMHDVVAEPYRSALIPGYYEVKQAALDAGALGAGISGSGPSVFALSNDEKKARVIAKKMSEEFNKLNIGNDVYVSQINSEGPVVL